MNAAKAVTATFNQLLISTAAGTGIAGYSGDGNAALNAQLYHPYATALDIAGNLYIADSDNCVIRRVAASNGTITTVAGNGTCGNSGNGGLATSAQLNGPRGVALDASGNIYVSDTNNNHIDVVSASTGIIQSMGFWGTLHSPCTTLSQPTGLAVAGNYLYFVDTGHHQVCRTQLGSGTSGLVAGAASPTGGGSPGFSGDGASATSARLNTPTGVSLDASGNIFIADSLNQRIRKINASTKIISTVAGSGPGGSGTGDYSGDGGPATSAELNVPSGVGLDASGNIYIADTQNNRIRKVMVSTGVISTLAGNGSAGYLGDGGPATNAELNGPTGLVLNSTGDVYVADYYNNRVRKIAP